MNVDVGFIKVSNHEARKSLSDGFSDFDDPIRFSERAAKTICHLHEARGKTHKRHNRKLERMEKELAAERELHRSTLNRLAEVVKTSLSQKELRLLQSIVKDGWEYLDLDEDEEALGKKLGLR